MKCKDVAKLIGETLTDDVDAWEIDKHAPDVVFLTFGAKTFQVTIEEFDSEEDDEDETRYLDDDENASIDDLGDL